MTEYKKEAPKLVWYSFENEEEQKKFKMPEPTIEAWLAAVLERLDNIYKWEEYHRKSRWFNKQKSSLQKEIEDMRDYIRKAWDLVPDEPEKFVSTGTYTSPTPLELCKKKYTTIVAGGSSKNEKA